MQNQVSPIKDTVDVTSPYYTFKYSVRSEITRKYYERRLRTFFDFNDFLVGGEIEERCNTFAEKAKKDNDWTTVLIISFIQYEKERVEKGEITAATLTNFVKSPYIPGTVMIAFNPSFSLLILVTKIRVRWN